MEQLGRRGLTLVEVLVVLVAIALIIGIWLPAIGRGHPPGGRQLRDATQVRGIHQGLVLWAQNNDDRYPLPSVVDGDNHTVAGVEPLAKDTTGNIYSILVYHGLNPTEMFISPSEVNPAIEEHANFELTEPVAAANPARALWDPAFRSSPDQAGDGPHAGIGHTSYAHTPTFGPRGDTWFATYSASEAVLANRGPRYVGSPGAWALEPGSFGAGSQTLDIHGQRGSWSGNIAFNDQHVDFEGRPDPDGLTLADGRNDNIFVNEDDGSGLPSRDLDQANVFLRIVHGVTGVREVMDDSGELRSEPTVAWEDLWVD